MSDGISAVQPGMMQGQGISLGDNGYVIGGDNAPLATGPAATPSFATDPAHEAPFAGLLEKAMADVNEKGAIAQQKSNEFLAGRSDDIHGTMIASKEAEIELHLVASVKNKVVDAINDLLRMSI